MPFDSNCEIRRAGITSDGRAQLDMKATDGRFDWRWFFSTPERAKEVLAVALTALASNKLVYCYMDDPDQGVVGNFGFVK
jgi:hypothetical protein